MIGIAIRIGQRMGIHSETSLAKCSVFEAEMRRRLWWSLVLFDSRIGEMASYKAMTLTPTWDCRVPLNVSDSDLREHMKEPPAAHERATEALFPVLRSKLGEFIRNDPSHLEFYNPALKAIAKELPAGGDAAVFESIIEEQYLRFCDPAIPSHFMTIWVTRGRLAKYRLVERYSKFSKSAAEQTDAQRDAAISYALRMVECDTKIMTSPLTQGFLWLAHMHFPFPAYIHLTQSLKRRPLSERARQAWEMMSDNHEARSGLVRMADGPFYGIFANFVLQAWEACEVAFRQSSDPIATPRIILQIRHTLAQMAPDANVSGAGQSHGSANMDGQGLSMSTMMVDSSNPPHGMGNQPSYAMGSSPFPDMPDLDLLGFDANQLAWPGMDWDVFTAPNGTIGLIQEPSMPY